MGPAGPAHSTRTRFTAASRTISAVAAAGSEGGQLLGEFRRTAMRTFGSFPIGGSDQDLTVPFAFVAMKFVDRHGAMVDD